MMEWLHVASDIIDMSLNSPVLEARYDYLMVMALVARRKSK